MNHIQKPSTAFISNHKFKKVQTAAKFLYKFGQLVYFGQLMDKTTTELFHIISWRRINAGKYDKDAAWKNFGLSSVENYKVIICDGFLMVL